MARNRPATPGELITRYIEAHDMSQTAFAELAGTSQGMVSQWKSGARPVSAKCAILIEQATAGELHRRDICPDVFKHESSAA